jgi:hypothetical protein
LHDELGAVPKSALEPLLAWKKAGKLPHGTAEMIDRAFVGLVARAVLGLAAGILTGAAIAVVELAGPITAVSDTCRLLLSYLNGPSEVHELGPMIVGGEWKISLIVGTGIAIIATPIWLILAHFRRDKVVEALLLGAMLGGGIGVAERLGPDQPVSEYAKWLFLFALAGATAGLVTWRVSHPPLRQA